MAQKIMSDKPIKISNKLLLRNNGLCNQYTKDITWKREDMNIIVFTTRK